MFESLVIVRLAKIKSIRWNTSFHITIVLISDITYQKLFRMHELCIFYGYTWFKKGHINTDLIPVFWIYVASIMCIVFPSKSPQKIHFSNELWIIKSFYLWKLSAMFFLCKLLSPVSESCPSRSPSKSGYKIFLPVCLKSPRPATGRHYMLLISAWGTCNWRFKLCTCLFQMMCSPTG